MAAAALPPRERSVLAGLERLTRPGDPGLDRGPHRTRGPAGPPLRRPRGPGRTAMAPVRAVAATGLAPGAAARDVAAAPPAGPAATGSAAAHRLPAGTGSGFG
ncbi:hypothetical protein BX265_0738 [Streptomyces sp. TLI_235]|nr:hypothetical protein BX265_0738 [Streptomyces sp. TLI_235]